MLTSSAIATQVVLLKSDTRGYVFEPINLDTLAGQRNVHAVFTLPGCVRGNHYHQHATEIAVVPGPALVRFRDAGTIRDVAVPAGQTFRFTFPPRVSHAILNTGLEPLWMIAFSTRRHDPAAPDVVADSLIEPQVA